MDPIGEINQRKRKSGKASRTTKIELKVIIYLFNDSLLLSQLTKF